MGGCLAALCWMINYLVVSGEALGEYENLHRKFAIEQECRDKAEEYAKMVKLVCTQSDDTQAVPLSFHKG